MLKKALKKRRLELGLTMLDVAKAVGVSESTISRWESGDISNMRQDRIVALCNVLQSSPTQLFGWQKIQNACKGEKEKKMAKRTMTDYEVEQEIKRLNASPAVALARQEQRLIYRRRQYMYNLRWLEERGKELMAMGVTSDTIEEQLAKTDAALNAEEG